MCQACVAQIWQWKSADGPKPIAGTFILRTTSGEFCRDVRVCDDYKMCEFEQYINRYLDTQSNYAHVIGELAMAHLKSSLDVTIGEPAARCRALKVTEAGLKHSVRDIMAKEPRDMNLCYELATRAATELYEAAWKAQVKEAAMKEVSDKFCEPAGAQPPDPVVTVVQRANALRDFAKQYTSDSDDLLALANWMELNRGLPGTIAPMQAILKLVTNAPICPCTR